jgi:hypothetical protein
MIFRKLKLTQYSPLIFFKKTTEITTLCTFNKHFNSCTYVSTICYRMPVVKIFVTLGSEVDNSSRNNIWMFRESGAFSGGPQFLTWWAMLKAALIKLLNLQLLNLRVFIFHVTVKINSDCFFEQPKPTGIHSEELCSPWGTNSCFILRRRISDFRKLKL